MIDLQVFERLGLALAVGLLIERGWHEREAAEGSRIAGIRTSLASAAGWRRCC